MRPRWLGIRLLVLAVSGAVLALMLSSSAYRRALFVYGWRWTHRPGHEAAKVAVRKPAAGPAGARAGAPKVGRARSEKEKFLAALVAGAVELTHRPETYDPSYFVIPYPGGDVPPDRGVCSDVIIRAYRHAGVDLQKEVHEDMAANFGKYPRIWGLSAPDPNIDHRRVPNLMTFFSRKGIMLPITDDPADYRPGDIVAWSLGGGVTHIGLVSDRTPPGGPRYLIVHNIGSGPHMEDMLFDYPIIGHFRYLGPAAKNN